MSAPELWRVAALLSFFLSQTDLYHGMPLDSGSGWVGVGEEEARLPLEYR